MTEKRRKSDRRYVKTLILCGILLFLAIVGYKGYEIYLMHRQIADAEEKKIELMREKEELETKKKDLEDPEMIEKKARDELGMVKPGEVPYIK